MSHNVAMRAMGAILIIFGFIVAWVFYAIYWTGYVAKRLASKQGRKEIKVAVTDTANFIAKDKYFHNEINKAFRGTYIVLGLVVIALIASALGLG